MAHAAPTVEPLRPATLTDMLDGGWRLLRSQPGTILGLGALFLAPSAILAGLAASSADTSLASSFGVLSYANDDGSFPAGALLGALGSGLLRSLGVLYLGVALTLVVVAARSATPLGAVAAARAALARSGAVLGAWPLLTLASLVGYAACGLPLLAWLTFTAVVAPAIALEGLGPIAAIGRSWTLVARRFWVSAGVVLLSSLVAYVLGSILLILPQALAGTLPWAAQWAATALVNLLAAAVTVGPLVISSSVLLYLDLRVRTEGLDLRMRASAAFDRPGSRAG